MPVPEASLKIFGDVQDNDLYKDIQNYLKEHRLEERVEILPATDDVISELKKAYMFVLSSDYEGMPNSLIEALSMGIPCISTDCPCGGPGELLTMPLKTKDEDEVFDATGERLVLVPVCDADAMSEAMLELINNPSGANELSKKGRTVRKQLAPDKIADEWLEFIQKVKR